MQIKKGHPKTTRFKPHNSFWTFTELEERPLHADVAYILQKHPEVFRSQDDVVEHIAEVIAEATDTAPGARKNSRLVLKKSNRKAMVMEILPKKDRFLGEHYIINSAYTLKPSQVERILGGKNDGNSPPVRNPVASTMGRTPPASGSEGLLSEGFGEKHHDPNDTNPPDARRKGKPRRGATRTEGLEVSRPCGSGGQEKDTPGARSRKPNPSSAVPEPVPESRRKGQIVQGGGASCGRASEDGKRASSKEGASEHSARLPGYSPDGQSINCQEGASSKGHSTPGRKQEVTRTDTRRKRNPYAGPMSETTGRKKAATTSKGKTPKAPIPAARAKKPTRPTSRPAKASHRLNPSDAEGLAKVWKAWTGTDPDKVLQIEVEEARKLNLPAQVVLLGRLSWLATKTGEEKRFGDSGPLMVTDAKASRIWLVSHRNHKFDMEPALIGYLARKPKFGDQGLVEYVHAFEGRAHAVMGGQVGALTGTFRITPAGLEG